MDSITDNILSNLKKVDLHEEGYFLVRENDMELMKQLLNQLGMKQEIRKGYFSIGGFKFVDEVNRFEYSCTLGEKRDEQFAWFRNHSGFKVVESEDE